MFNKNTPEEEMMKNSILSNATNTMKKVSLAVVLGLGATSAMAHNSFSTDNCAFDMNYNINIDENSVRLSDEDSEYVQIDANNNLYLKGVKQSLTKKQKSLLAEYAAEMREFLPVVDEVATEAVHLALDAVTDVSKALLVDSPDQANNLRSRVEVITNKVKENVSNRHLHPKSLEAYLNESEFEEEFEVLIREIMADVVKSNIGNVIAAAIRGDDAEVEAFEKRMEQFGEDMETKYEKKAERLGEKAEELCELAEKIDRTENKFVSAFSEYEAYELIKESD